MRKSLIAASTVVALGLMGCQPQSSNTEQASEAETPSPAPAQDTSAMTDEQKHAYAMGASMGLFVKNRQQQFEQLGGAMDVETLIKGFTDNLNDKGAMSDQEIQQYAQAGEQEFQRLQQAQAEKASEDNLKAGAAFLVENATKEGVVTTESGLQYEVVQAGEGESPAATDSVTVHYTGTLLDGTEFDSSHKRGQPASFRLNQVISGWTEGLQLMKKGAKYRFYIPANLAYGNRATGLITPNSTLIFDVDLLEVTKVEVPASE